MRPEDYLNPETLSKVEGFDLRARRADLLSRIERLKEHLEAL